MVQSWLVVITLVVLTWDDPLHCQFLLVTLSGLKCRLWASNMPGNCRLAHSSQHHPNCSEALVSLQTWDLLGLNVILILGLKQITGPHFIGSTSIKLKTWAKKTKTTVLKIPESLKHDRKNYSFHWFCKKNWILQDTKQLDNFHNIKKYTMEKTWKFLLMVSVHLLCNKDPKCWF